MNKSEMFKLAHEEAKKVHRKGECYRTTFGSAYSNIIENLKGEYETDDVVEFKGRKTTICSKNKKRDGFYFVSIQLDGKKRKLDQVHVSRLYRKHKE